MPSFSTDTAAHGEDRAERASVTLLAGRRRRSAGANPLVLTPDDPFPDDLDGLDLVDLQVLHSRLCWQLDHEYLSLPGGADPVTLDRHQDVTAEMTRRRWPSSPPRPVP
ncbi:hypothetical protein GCM10011512_18070 [Tersicoccus solisilvae]|uniref:Uncharacterized protein n=1 Tax=Tersicoccus solisilvae TaxID=1882339 RepID=A0ABQ1PB73_9MICC|nr:hypothetical protein [Tersicoccus solisilvae]GGC91385.1 hypothetical protein GCM10011512_18070 [Tersicoccus solisilvae]